ncbi:zinc finger protein ZAT5-like isoform X2 [Curcuma longa]
MGRRSSSRDDDRFVTSNLVKRRRTKRRAAPAAVGPDSSVSSVEISSSTAVAEEDEDVANCLILLARGRATPTRTAPDAYRCKTCSKRFPSFQALGGHRTSHKKPKTVALLDAADETVQVHQEAAAGAATASSNDDAAAGNKPRVHECSICGAEFSSGQALGGHMRRHRPLTSPAGAQQIIKQDKTVFSLDLNLPAPADDDCELANITKSPAVPFPFETQRPLVFSASSLVRCHY